MKNIFVLLACLLFLAAPLPARADGRADAKTQSHDANDIPVFKSLLATGGRMEFLGTEQGVDGWIFLDEKRKRDVELYVLPGGAIIQGILFGPDGRAVTPAQVAAFRARTNGAQGAIPGAERGTGTKAEQLYALLEHSNWLRMGATNAPYLYMVFNPTCPDCQDLWKKLAPSVKEGKLQVRLVPFGSDPVNVGPGGALMSVDNPMQAWQDFVAGNKEALGKDKIKPEGAKKFEENTKLCKVWVQVKMPFVLYRKLSDGALNAIVGEPDNVMLVEADLMKSN
jgi:hypothetical protein